MDRVQKESQPPCTEDEYARAIKFLERFDDGNTQPSEECLKKDFNPNQYTDDEIWTDLLKTGISINTPPNKEKMVSKAKESMVLVDDVPQAEADKQEKLKKKVEEKVIKYLADANKGSIKIVHFDIPFNDETGKNESYGLFQLESEQKARDFARIINDAKFTKKNIFKTYNLSDIDRYLNAPDEWVEPEGWSELQHQTIDDDTERWQNDVNDHLLILRESRALILRNKIGGVTKQMAPTGPEYITEKSGVAGPWPNIEWSPNGNFLIVLDDRKRGAGVFTVKDDEVDEYGEHQVSGFKLHKKFAVPNSFQAVFSPDERHVMLLSGVTDQNGYFIEDRTVKPKISIFDLVNKSTAKEGREKKEFRFNAGRHYQEIWEMFQWTDDGSYLVTKRRDQLHIFDARNDFKALRDPENRENEYISCGGTIRSFIVSPKDNYVGYWIPEEGEKPLKFVIKEIPSMENIKQQTLYGVKDLEIKWHPQGTYLALRACLPMKGRKGSLQMSFKLFHIKEKGIPMDTVDCENYICYYDHNDPTKEFEGRQPIGGFEWEPCGNRFAVYYGPNDKVTKTEIKLFKPQVGNNRIKVLPMIERSSLHNALRWSPTGRYFVLATFKSQQGSGGALEFVDADGELMQDANNKYIKNKNKDLRKPITLENRTHQFITDLVWDSTGRYCVTYSSAYEHNMENGYNMWNFQGKDLYEEKMDKLKKVSWRPRPKSVLSDNQLKEIQKNIKEYARQFQESDAIKSSEVGAEEQRKLLTNVNDWNGRINSYNDSRERMADYLRELDGGDQTDDEKEVETTTIISRKEDTVGRQPGR